MLLWVLQLLLQQLLLQHLQPPLLLESLHFLDLRFQTLHIVKVLCGFPVGFSCLAGLLP